jgi:hypothetical protein
LAIIIEQLKFKLFTTVDIQNYKPEVQPRLMNAFIQASVFLQRYYLMNSILDCDPKKMMKVCLVLAFKTEEVLASGEPLLRQFCEEVKEDTQ